MTTSGVFPSTSPPKASFALVRRGAFGIDAGGAGHLARIAADPIPRFRDR